MRRALTTIAVVVIALAALAPPGAGQSAPSVREGAKLAVPLYGEMVRPWDAPANPFAPGHRGVDVAAPFGSPVYASADGVVSFAGVVAGNRTVTVDHADAVQTSYSFLSETLVARGAVVERGDAIGRTGAGHPSSGLPPHTHLSVRKDGLYEDPLPWYIGTSHADLLSLTA